MHRRFVGIMAVAFVVTCGVARVGDAADEWTTGAVKGLLPGGKESQEKTTLVGKVVSREEKDRNGKSVTAAFLEQDDGSLVPLPCTPRADGIAGKATGKIKGDESCWKHLGQKVELVGTAQSITKDARRIRRLARITSIKPF